MAAAILIVENVVAAVPLMVQVVPEKVTAPVPVSEVVVALFVNAQWVEDAVMLRPKVERAKTPVPLITTVLAAAAAVRVTVCPVEMIALSPATGTAAPPQVEVELQFPV